MTTEYKVGRAELSRWFSPSLSFPGQEGGTEQGVPAFSQPGSLSAEPRQQAASAVAGPCAGKPGGPILNCCPPSSRHIVTGFKSLEQLSNAPLLSGDPGVLG